MSRTRDVVVVGAGAAGLACARALHGRGLDVVVVEQADAVGGRMRTDDRDGFLLDRGFQVLPTSYPEVRRLLDVERLGLRSFAPGAVVRHDGRFRRVADPRRMPVRALRSLAAGSVSVRDAVGVLALLRRGPETTTAAALRSAPLSHATRTALLEPFLRGITLEPTLETSSAFLRFALQTFARGTATLPARGIRGVPEQLAEGLDVRTGVQVAAVGPGAVSLADGTTLSARAVVVATAGLVDDATDGWNGVTCVSYAAAAAPIPGPWLTLADGSEGPICSLCVPSEVQPTYAPPGKALVSVSVLGAGEPDLEAVESQLHGWFGSATRGWSRLGAVTVPRALPRYPVGARPAASPRLSPGLFACGDHREHPSLDGALRSGRATAEAVAADLA